MEKENKLELDDKIKIIDKLIADEQEAIDEYNKAIDKLKGNVCPRVLEDLGFIYNDEVHHIAKLEEIKKKMQNNSLGDTYADEVFGMERYY